MALAKPTAMSESLFIKKAQRVQEWFTPLNPYAAKAPLLKIEGDNYSLSNSKALQPLYCYAVSSKRYALFNIVEGKPILRKVSAHGLGHLIAPYQRDGSKLEGVEAWQQDFWLEIISAEIKDRSPDFTKLENFDKPCISRYAATTPALEKWFSQYNKDKPYDKRVRPFNFLLALQANKQLKSLKPVAPYDKDRTAIFAKCFDRATGQKVTKRQLKINLDALAQYHLHPESKFLNGDYSDSGITQRRHVKAKGIRYIGKEASKWEEQYYTGADPDSQIEYGIDPKDKIDMLKIILQTIATHGIKAVSDASRMSCRHVTKIYKGQSQPSNKSLAMLYATAQHLETENVGAQATIDRIKIIIESKTLTLRGLAANLGVDHSNLAKFLSGKRKSTDLVKRINGYLRDVI